jgi:hypothetical protein
MIAYSDFEKVAIGVGNAVLVTPTKEVPLGGKLF